LTNDSIKVLVVDDDPSIRLLCRVNLELDGCTVLEAGGLNEARELLTRNAVDVVLLDVHVGRDDGRELLRELRRSSPGTPVAFLTGSVDRGALESGTERADAVIPKPFRLEELTSTVKDLAGRRREIDSGG
jgi:two-component system KDP operon response regulator KdpE